MDFKSNFRFAFLKETRKNHTWENVIPYFCPWDCNHLAVNTRFLAVPLRVNCRICILDVTKTMNLGGERLNFINAAASSSKVYDLKFSPFDESLLATSSTEKIIRFWKIPEEGLVKDIDTSSCLQELNGHERNVGVIGFHPTCNYVVASTSNDRTMKIWDIEKSEEKISIDFPKPPLQFDWNGVGNLMCSVTMLLVIIKPNFNYGIETQNRLSQYPQVVDFWYLDKSIAVGSRYLSSDDILKMSNHFTNIHYYVPSLKFNITFQRNQNSIHSKNLATSFT